MGVVTNGVFVLKISAVSSFLTSVVGVILSSGGSGKTLGPAPMEIIFVCINTPTIMINIIVNKIKK
jgi:hypothetical protein